MSEIMNCLPIHTRQYFIRVNNERSEVARSAHTLALQALRGESAAKGVLKSGYQMMQEWELAETFIRALAQAYFDSAIDTCSLYEGPLEPQIAKCLENGIRGFIVAQYRNAIKISGTLGGHIKIPHHLVGQVSSNCSDCRFPVFNSIMIQLESERVKSAKATVARKAAQANMTVTTKTAATSSLQTATVIRILIASPGDVPRERDVVTECIYAWNAAHYGTSGIMLQPVRWETHSYPASGDRPQALINRPIVEGGDCLIGIFGVRLGTPTGEALSGTIEEIEIFRNAGKHVSLYFSIADAPRDADREQLAALQAYQRERQKDMLYFEFPNPDELRRLVTHHLPGIVHAVTKQSAMETGQATSQLPKNDLARVFIRSRPGTQSGDVKTVQVSAVIENVSANRKISDYVCTLSIPKACLTHTSAVILGEIRKEDQPNRRFFRRSNNDPGAVPMIFQGDKVPIFALDVGVDQLRLTGTYLAGDYEGTLADKVSLEAVVEGELLRAERTVSDLFKKPNQG